MYWESYTMLIYVLSDGPGDWGGGVLMSLKWLSSSLSEYCDAERMEEQQWVFPSIPPDCICFSSFLYTDTMVTSLLNKR